MFTFVGTITKVSPKRCELVPLVKVDYFTHLNELEVCAEKQKYSCGNLVKGIVLKDHNNYSLSLKIINKGYNYESCKRK